MCDLSRGTVRWGALSSDYDIAPTELGAITGSALFCLKVFVGAASSMIGKGKG